MQEYNHVENLNTYGENSYRTQQDNQRGEFVPVTHNKEAEN